MADNEDSITGDRGPLIVPGMGQAAIKTSREECPENSLDQVSEPNKGMRHQVGCGACWLLLGATAAPEEDKQRLRVVNHQLKAN